MSSRTHIPQEILEDAAEWFAKLETESPSEATRTAFVQWLRRSPVHIEEFLRVAALHHALSKELQARPEWVAGVIAEARSSDENVVRLVEPEPVARNPERSRLARPRQLLAAAAVLIAAVGLGVVMTVTDLAGRGERVATTVGEQRQIVLADGSSVVLNTDTELRIRMASELRQVDLVRGEVIFEVEKDPARPFRVLSGRAMVEAIGTRFIVRRLNERTVVTVVEGRVRVQPISATESVPPPSEGDHRERGDGSESTVAIELVQATRSVELDAGRTITVTMDGIVTDPVAADLESVTSWTRGRMIFDSDTLDTVVAEFNRYTTTPLVIRDAELSNRRISGVFNIDNPEAFLGMLSDLDGVSVSRTAEGSWEIRPGAGRPRPAEDGNPGVGPR